MERLKTRQRLEKLNLVGSPTPLVLNEVRNQQPDDETDTAHLASKIRVANLINQSIPDMIYAPKKIKSNITAKELEEYQRKELMPIEIDGQFFRFHPASIPEPELKEDDRSSEIQRSIDEASKDRSMISIKLTQLQEAEERLPNLVNQMTRLDAQFNGFVAIQGIKPSSPERYQQTEREYIRAKYQLEQDTDELIAFIEDTRAEIDDARTRIEAFDEVLPDLLARSNAIKNKNKALVTEYIDNLKTVNRNFNIVQEQGESEENYLARVKAQTEAVVSQDSILDRFNLDEARRFKENLKEIIRSNATIEYAYNTLFQENDASISEVNKMFQLIKTRYEKMYGTFQLKDDDLVRFLKQIIENPEETVRKAEEEEAQIIGLSQGGAGGGRDFTEKYKALNKGKRYTKEKLSKAIETVFDMFLPPENFEMDIGGQPAILSKGVRGGYSVNYKGKIQALRLEQKPTLLALYVGLLEKLKRIDPTSYDEINAEINSKTDQEYGEGIGVPHEPLPKSCKLGKIEIDLNKLFYKNILSVKHNGFKINGAKNVPVGDEFVKIIMELCKGKSPTTKELNKLGVGESQVYDALLHLAGLHKRVEHTANKTVDTLKKRLTLIEGEITAGNTNNKLYQELRDIVFKLHHLGEITGNSANAYLKQLK